MQNSSTVMDSLYILGLIPVLSRQCLLVTHLSTPPSHVIVGGIFCIFPSEFQQLNLHFTIISPLLQTMLHLVNNCLNVVTTDISLPSHAGPFLRLATDIHTQSHPVCRLPLSSLLFPSFPQHPLQSELSLPETLTQLGALMSHQHTKDWILSQLQKRQQ